MKNKMYKGIKKPVANTGYSLLLGSFSFGKTTRA